jgi:hypothetical protein
MKDEAGLDTAITNKEFQQWADDKTIYPKHVWIRLDMTKADRKNDEEYILLRVCRLRKDIANYGYRTKILNRCKCWCVDAEFNKVGYKMGVKLRRPETGTVIMQTRVNQPCVL